MVKDKYLPLASFTYGELDSDAYKALEPCPGCAPVKRKSVIDQINRDRGFTVADSAADTADVDGTAATQSSLDEGTDETEHPVEITIVPAGGK